MIVMLFTDFEEKQAKLKALTNRQDLFQEEVSSKSYNVSVVFWN